ncbi:hypothetical protein ACFZB5_24265 [Streptomyces nodosus]|uniref:hypothetical protein n=1 Tax=Streptomyces nodosus TaxID=40318 RepID=UPI0036E35A10
MAEAYDNVVAFRHASACQSQAEDNCIAKVTGTVIDKQASESCTSDSNGIQSCTPYYDLRLRYGDRTAVRGVSSDMYEDVHRGDHAELSTWREAVVSLTVRGHTHTYDPPASDSVMWRLGAAWLILGVAVWAAVGGRPAIPLIVARIFVWFWLALPVSLLIRGALLGMSAWEWIWIAVFVVFGVIFAFATLRDSKW